MATRTLLGPEKIATTSSAGLLSAADKSKLDNLIDDTAGASDTSSTWSADKLTTELSTLSGSIPSSISDLTDDSDFVTNTALSALLGANSGIAELDSAGKVPSSQLPSYVDDVEEYSALASFPAEGESGKIYIDTATNITYRWGGSTYVPIGSDLALGTTESTAFRGDYGAAAYAHAVTNKGSAFTSDLYKITTNAEGHVTAATTVVKADITALGIPAQDTTYSSLTAASSGTDVSLVTTGEKYTWNNKIDNSEKGAANGIATLDANGKVPSTQLPDIGGVTYTLGQDSSDGHIVTLTPSAGDTQTITIPDNDTWIELSTANGGYVGSALPDDDEKFLDGEGNWSEPPYPVTSVAGQTGDVTLDKNDVGLGNVDNTADEDKPISSAMFDALSLKLDADQVGVANGVAELDSSGKVPTSQLPSYVDDVVEYASVSNFPAEGETGKIYVALDTNKTYRWGGSEYVEISASLALGETSDTAYRGDRGKTAYDHASAKGNAYASGLYKITTNSEGHVTGATAVAKGDITALGIPGQDTTYESKAAASGGTDVSLVTTGEKYNWNNVIDDTAGDGDTGKTWSADKLVEEIPTFRGGNIDDTAIATFTAEHEGIVNWLKAKITAVQEGSGDPSPSNVRAISGWTGANVVTYGKNIIGGCSSATLSNVVFTVKADGTIATQNTANANAIFDIGSTEYIPFRFSSGEEFVLTGCPSNGGNNKYRIRFGTFYKGTRYGSYYYDDGDGVTIDPSASAPAEALATGLIDITVKIIIYSGQNANNLVFSPMLRKSTDTDATYAQYKGGIYPITFPTSAGTVYGGELTVNADGTGTLKQTHQYYEFDGSNDEDWVSEGSGTYKFARITIERYKDRYGVHKCNEFTQGTIGNNTSDIGYDFLNNNHICVRFDLSTSLTVDAIRAYFAEHPLQIVYELATPVTYDLTAPQIRTLLVNNIWCDTGNVSIEWAQSDEHGTDETTVSTGEKARWNSTPLYMDGEEEFAPVVSFHTDTPAAFNWLKAHVVVKQTGTGDPSPSNVRAITAYNAAKIMATGKNLHYSLCPGRTNGGCVFTVTDGVVSIDTTNITATAWLISDSSAGNYVQLFKAGAYTLTSPLSKITVLFIRYNADASVTTIATAEDGGSVTFTITEDMYAWVQVRVDSTASYAGVALDIQLERGNVATAYEPFRGEICTVNFPSAIGGGELYLHQDGSATLVQTHGIVTVTEESQLGSFTSSNDGSYAAIISTSAATDTGTPNIMASNCLPISYDDRVASEKTAYARTYASTGSNRIVLRCGTGNNATTLSELFAIFEGGQFVYPLLTPVIHTLTAPQVHALVGLNHVWCDTGDIALHWSVSEEYGTDHAYVTTGEKYKWNNSLEGLRKDVNGSRIWKGTSSTANNIQEKQVTIDGLTELVDGDLFAILFTTTQGYNGNPTLNVNELGAKPIRVRSATGAVRYEWTSNSMILMEYDGTAFVMFDRGHATTTYYGATKLNNSATSTETGMALTPSGLNSLSQNMVSGAEVYSASATYAVGDRVRYNYQTWVCNTTISTAEAWNANHWTALDPLQTQVDDKTFNRDIAVVVDGNTAPSRISKNQYVILRNSTISGRPDGLYKSGATIENGATISASQLSSNTTNLAAEIKINMDNIQKIMTALAENGITVS